MSSRFGKGQVIGLGKEEKEGEDHGVRYLNLRSTMRR